MDSNKSKQRSDIEEIFRLQRKIEEMKRELEVAVVDAKS